MPLHTWDRPDTTWKSIHVDFAGLFLGKTFLLIVDAHSKWPEVEIMSSTTPEKTMDVLRMMFAHYELPEQLVKIYCTRKYAEYILLSNVRRYRSSEIPNESHK